MTAPLVLTMVVQKKYLVLNAKQENFKMSFNKQIAKVCSTFLLKDGSDGAYKLS
jgi:hypothetical protein